jgi:hypothetical protein
LSKDYRATSVNLTVVPGKRYDFNPHEFSGRVSIIQDEVHEPPQERWRGRMTWLAVDDRQHGIRKTRVNVRLDREQAVNLADAIIGPPDGTGLLTRDEAVKRVAFMCRQWGITSAELEAEQVIQALGGLVTEKCHQNSPDATRSASSVLPAITTQRIAT